MMNNIRFIIYFERRDWRGAILGLQQTSCCFFIVKLLRLGQPVRIPNHLILVSWGGGAARRKLFPRLVSFSFGHRKGKV
jgi:hypothetical protein